MLDIIREIECPRCCGNGQIYGPNSGADIICPDCLGEGWRAMTVDELDDAAEAAWSDACEGEPPITMQERHRSAWDLKQQLRGR